MRQQVEQLLIDQKKTIQELQKALDQAYLYPMSDDRRYIRGHIEALEASNKRLQQILELDVNLSEVMF